MAYVDGFLLAVPKSKLEEYRALTTKMEPFFREFGATEYVECVGDDVPYGELTSFPRAVQATDDETVIFSWVVYPSKEVRDDANRKMMADERLQFEMADMPFDGKRMMFGGFKPILGL